LDTASISFRVVQKLNLFWNHIVNTRGPYRAADLIVTLWCSGSGNISGPFVD
jgi:hypothetical protein